MPRHFIYKSPKLKGQNVMSKAQTNLQMPQDTTFVWVIKATKHKDKYIFIGMKNVHVQRHYSQFWTSTLQLKKTLRIHFTFKWQNSN